MDDCEICLAREAIGTFDVDDVETLLCEVCAGNPRTLNGAVVIPML
jgi:hypothetical protein